jgi:sigma-E factor negative regulatory protein RseA
MNPEKDNQDIHEQLSALIDGELERDSARFLLRRIGHDEELAARWDRWHRYGETMRGAALPLREDFAASIMAAISDAPAGQSAPERSPRVLRWGGGFAVAASVALAALLLVKPGHEGSGLQVPGAELGSGLAVTPDSSQVAPSPYREQDLRLPQYIDAQTVSSLSDPRYGMKFGFDPNAEAYWLRHRQAVSQLPGARAVDQGWTVPMRAPQDDKAAPAAQ